MRQRFPFTGLVLEKESLRVCSALNRSETYLARVKLNITKAREASYFLSRKYKHFIYNSHSVVYELCY